MVGTIGSPFPFLLEIGLLFGVLLVLILICERLRLPPVIGFLLAGLFLGSFWQTEAVDLLGEIGIVLLFFLLGVEFPVNRLGNMLSQVWPAGLIDVAFNFGLTSLLALTFSLPPVEALLVGAICYASSSSIILKVLEDTRRLGNPETEFIVGVLVFEDVLAPVMVAVMVALLGTEVQTMSGLAVTVARVVFLTVTAVAISWLLGRIKEFLETRLQDASLAIFLLAAATLYSGLSFFWGVSEVLGAFLAGIMMAELGRKDEIETIVTPIRDVFLPLYFLGFAAGIELDRGVPAPWLLLAATIWSVLGKLLVATWGGRQSGLGVRPRWRAGLSLAARGEFSIILAGIATAWLQTWAGLYVLATALSGVLLLQAAPHLVQRLFPRQRPQSAFRPGATTGAENHHVPR